MRPGIVLLAAAVLLVPGVAAAQNPSPYPPNCTVDPVIVGDSNGMKIGNGYRVIIRDHRNVPLQGVQVTVNFQQGVFPYANQPAPTTTDCALRIIGQFTDVNGLVTFVPRIGGYQNAAVMAIKTDGMFLTQISGRSTDLDANGTTDIGDFSHFRTNYLTNPTAQETDYDQSGATDIADFSIFRQVYLNDIAGAVCH